ncbi:MAG: hypothetical protein ABIA93_07605 [Candidatus Woesearchaeota archaeon]
MTRELKYSRELLQDLNALIEDFGFFMTLNLVHADQGLPDPKPVTRLIQYSNQNATKITNVFEQPLLNHEQKNRERLEKNITHILRFMHEYLQYTGHVLRHRNQKLYEGRYTSLLKHYSQFISKYHI